MLTNAGSDKKQERLANEASSLINSLCIVQRLQMRLRQRLAEQGESHPHLLLVQHLSEIDGSIAEPFVVLCLRFQLVCQRLRNCFKQQGRDLDSRHADRFETSLILWLCTKQQAVEI